MGTIKGVAFNQVNTVCMYVCMYVYACVCVCVCVCGLRTYVPVANNCGNKVDISFLYIHMHYINNDFHRFRLYACICTYVLCLWTFVIKLSILFTCIYVYVVFCVVESYG